MTQGFEQNMMKHMTLLAYFIQAAHQFQEGTFTESAKTCEVSN